MNDFRLMRKYNVLWMCNKSFCWEKGTTILFFYLFAKMLKNIMWINYYNSHHCFEWNIFGSVDVCLSTQTFTRSTKKLFLVSLITGFGREWVKIKSNVYELCVSWQISNSLSWKRCRTDMALSLSIYTTFCSQIRNACVNLLAFGRFGHLKFEIFTFIPIFMRRFSFHQN